jgi:hypothetical protein
MCELFIALNLYNRATYRPGRKEAIILMNLLQPVAKPSGSVGPGKINWAALAKKRIGMKNAFYKAKGEDDWGIDISDQEPLTERERNADNKRARKNVESWSPEKQAEAQRWIEWLNQASIMRERATRDDGLSHDVQVELVSVRGTLSNMKMVARGYTPGEGVLENFDPSKPWNIIPHCEAFYALFLPEGYGAGAGKFKGKSLTEGPQ